MSAYRLFTTPSFLLVVLCMLNGIAESAETNDSSTGESANSDAGKLQEKSFWQQNMVLILIISITSIVLLLLSIFLTYVDKKKEKQRRELAVESKDDIDGKTESSWDIA